MNTFWIRERGPRGARDHLCIQIEWEKKTVLGLFPFPRRRIFALCPRWSRALSNFSDQVGACCTHGGLQVPTSCGGDVLRTVQKPLMPWTAAWWYERLSCLMFLSMPCRCVVVHGAAARAREICHANVHPYFRPPRLRAGRPGSSGSHVSKIAVSRGLAVMPSLARALQSRDPTLLRFNRQESWKLRGRAAPSSWSVS